MKVSDERPNDGLRILKAFVERVVPGVDLVLAGAAGFADNLIIDLVQLLAPGVKIGGALALH